MSVLRSRRSGPTPPGVILLPTSFFCRTHFIWPWMQGGPPSTSPTPVVATAGPANSTPGGPPSTSPTPVVAAVGPAGITPGGPPSTSPTPVVAAAEPAGSTPQGARHRRHQLWWWPLLDLPTAPSRGSAIDIANLLPATRIFLATPTREATTVNNTAIKNISGPCGAENPGVVIPLQKSPNQQTA
jgi:hypothetical protein